MIFYSKYINNLLQIARNTKQYLNNTKLQTNIKFKKYCIYSTTPWSKLHTIQRIDFVKLTQNIISLEIKTFIQKHIPRHYLQKLFIDWVHLPAGYKLQLYFINLINVNVERELVEIQKELFFLKRTNDFEINLPVSQVLFGFHEIAKSLKKNKMIHSKIYILS